MKFRENFGTRKLKRQNFLEDQGPLIRDPFLLGGIAGRFNWPVRLALMKSFSHKRPVREGNEIISLKPAPAVRVTENTLGRDHGSDAGRKLVVSLVDGDLITFRPQGCPASKRTKSISAFDVYAHVLRIEANAIARAKREEKRDKHQERLARARQERAEKRLTRPL